MFGFSIREILSNVVGSLVADAITPAGMIGWAVAIAFVVWWAIHWHRQQRAAKKLGMASWQFISICFVVALFAIAGGTYGLGLRGIGAQAGGEVPGQNKDVTPANPYPKSILTTRYYSRKNKEEVADILDKATDALNKQGKDIFSLAEIAINGSAWQRPGEDLVPIIDRVQHIEALTADFKRDLFEVLYRDYPDYRIELNNLLPPQVTVGNFQGGARDFYNALMVWRELRDTLDGGRRGQLDQLVGTARSAFGGFREEFLKWVTELEIRINQTRMALRQ